MKRKSWSPPAPWGGTHRKGHQAEVGIPSSLPGWESRHPLGYPTLVSSHLFCSLKDQMFQFQPLLRQTPPGVHASCRVLFAKMMLMQRDVSKIHGSCHATSPENSPPPQPHCHTKYQVSYNTVCCDCHHPTQHVTTRWHTWGILFSLQNLMHKKTLVREGRAARMKMGGVGTRSYAFCCYSKKKRPSTDKS